MHDKFVGKWQCSGANYVNFSPLPKTNSGFQLTAQLCMVQFYLLSSTGQPPGQVQSFRPWVGALPKAGFEATRKYLLVFVVLVLLLLLPLGSFF